MKLKPSARGKCVTISSPQPMKDFTVELRDTNNVFQSEHDYSVPYSTRRVMLWRDDPTLTAALTKVDAAMINVSEAIDTSERTTWEDAWQLQKFEHDQALFVRRGPITSDNTQWWSRAATEYQREFLQFLQQRSLFPGALDTERHEV
ncbi:uncharacterized protein [Littorina saxatilis]|uniref:uncharacterized protein n=1 Tax=Littorina saxatilis TaxID=31220 RepID=UPI0038B49B2F